MTKRVTKRGHVFVSFFHLLWFVRLVVGCRYKRFLSCLGCSSRPSTTNFFLTVHYFNLCVPIPQQGRQAAMLGRLSLSMCLCFEAGKCEVEKLEKLRCRVKNESKKCEFWPYIFERETKGDCERNL